MSLHIESICQKLRENSIEFSVISHKASILYALGLPPTHPTEREAYLLVTPSQVLLYHSPFVSPPGLPTTLTTGQQAQAIPMSRAMPLSALVKKHFGQADVVGIEAEDLTVAELERFSSFMDTPPESTPIDLIIKNCRLIKQPDELSWIKKAVVITTKTLRWVEQFIYSPAAIGITELALAKLIESKMYESGAQGLAFPTIVAFDAHSASPHHIPGNRRLRSNSIVLVDLGARYHYYCGDMTRTWCLGKPTALFTKIEHTVRDAYEAAYSRAQESAGQPVGAVDQAARDVIEAAGFGERFIHTTGHGIGLEAHEMPSVNSNNRELLLHHMVITIEPGIYLPGKFGYRHENTICI